MRRKIHRSRGLLLSIIVGLVGAALGGFLVSASGVPDMWASILIVCVGVAIFLFVMSLLTKYPSFFR